jgi:ABC-type branched-subunit amino acid transport system ATPase component
MNHAYETVGLATVLAALAAPVQAVVTLRIWQERARQRGGTLSGGQQEMLAIARALVGLPDLLLLDEPSDGVQPSIVQEIGDFLVKLVAERPIGILIVEQNVDLIQTVAQRAFVMDKGRLTASLDRAALADATALGHHIAL